MIALVALAAVYLLVPSYYYFKLPADVRNDQGELAKVLPGWASDKKLNLGLDLQGGIHLVMDVDTEAALRARAGNRAREVVDYLERKGITGAEGRAVGQRLEFVLPEGRASEAQKLIAEYEDMERVSSSANTVTYAFRPEAVRQLQDGAIDQSIKAIRNRIDKFGVTEPTIARRGDHHILVQLPGFKDPNEAKELIGRTAQLEFRIVNDEDRTLLNLSQQLPQGISVEFDREGGGPSLRSQNQVLLQQFVADKAPEGYEYMISRIEAPNRPVEFRTYLVEDRPGITGEYLTDARVQFSDDALQSRPHVSLEFNRRGADLFEKLTAENTGKRMAVVLDSMVENAPVIRERIGGGRAQITLGDFRPVNEVVREAQTLAMVLRAGALPAPVTIAEQRSVGASLGPELISSGATALVVGTLLVLLFMAFYYRTAGLIANVALVLNAVLILAALSLFGAALSMPGIAGIVLTLGMAVDANIIINERIREELRTGKSIRAAVRAGYDNAFSAIVDANITTVIAGLVLLQYGTGPIRGFAVTLIIGIAASMFTAIMVTRWLMDLVVSKRPQQLTV